MKTNFRPRFSNLYAINCIATTWTVMLSVSWALTANAQNVLRDNAVTPAADNQTLPVMPLAAPRPFQGTQPGQQWNTAPAGAPVTALVDTLKGNDAVINVVRGQGRLLTLRADIAAPNGVGAIAVGDPAVVEFQVLPNPRMIRVLGRREGITDLSITTVDGQTWNFEVHVLYDLEILQAQLRQSFPDASLKISQLRDHLVVEGEARTTAQVAEILSMIGAFVNTFESQQGAGRAPDPGKYSAALPYRRSDR